MSTYLPPQALENSSLASETVHLRKLVAADKERVCQWMASAFIINHSFVVPGPLSAVKDFGTYAYAERYFNLLISDPRRLTYAIIYHRQHIGTVGIKEIEGQQKAECFIEIGEGGFRGLGIGRQAMIAMLQVAFDTMGLTKLNLEVLEFNLAAIKLYHGLGFVTQDPITWHYDEFGMYWRVIRMSLAKDLWDIRRSRYVG